MSVKHLLTQKVLPGRKYENNYTRTKRRVTGTITRRWGLGFTKSSHLKTLIKLVILFDFTAVLLRFQTNIFTIRISETRDSYKRQSVVRSFFRFRRRGFCGGDLQSPLILNRNEVVQVTSVSRKSPRQGLVLGPQVQGDLFEDPFL